MSRSKRVLYSTLPFNVIFRFLKGSLAFLNSLSLRVFFPQISLFLKDPKRFLSWLCWILVAVCEELFKMLRQTFPRSKVSSSGILSNRSLYQLTLQTYHKNWHLYNAPEAFYDCDYSISNAVYVLLYQNLPQLEIQ